MAFIKSHSNYVLKSKHQAINDGTIWERDITTIGALNQFSPGQVPIYQSSNFIISVRGDSRVTNQYNTTKWDENDASGTVWTLESIEGMISDDERQDDTKIVLKQDYYDFRDFAYYGSLTELFRASVTDIVRRFPGELYCTTSGDSAIRYYQHSEIESGERVEYSIRLGGEESNLYEVSNPFGINIHSVYKPTDADELKYFADSGYKNYTIFSGEACDDTSESGCSITEWCSRNFIYAVIDQETLDERFGEDLFYNEYMRDKISTIASQPDREVKWIQNRNDEISGCGVDSSGESGTTENWNELVESFEVGEIHEKWLEYWNTRYHIIESSGETETESEEGFSSSTAAYEYVDELREDEANSGKTYILKEYNPCGSMDCYIMALPCKGYKAGSVTATSENESAVIGVWMGDNSEIIYLSEETEGIHIRPNKKFIDRFYNECDNFEYLLMNPKSTPLYKATFSVIRENEYGYYRKLETFEFPKTYGGYNIDTSDYGFNSYTDKMVEIGEYYDEYFSDNLYRSMTHESLKNFDWSFTREYSPGDEEEYVVGGEKFKKAMRIFAREFDEALSYIEAMKSMNVVTYDQRNNIPDYFLTDTVENEGWDVRLVIPYNLSEYYYNDNEKTYLEDEEYVEGGPCKGQLGNEYEGKHIIREFSQNSSETVKPYTKENLEYQDGYFMVCSGGVIPCWYEGSSYGYIPASSSTYYDSKAFSGKGSVKNRIKKFSDEREYTYLDVNNEFLRRLKLNSRDIWRHKGTIDGIEMILGMFGLRSKRWVDAINIPDGCSANKLDYDYDIEEYTSFAHRIEEQWDVEHQRYRIEWLNSTKTINYDNRFVSVYNQYGHNDRIMPYQGIPVSFRDEYEYKDEECSGKDDYAPYIKQAELDESWTGEVKSTKNLSDAFKDITANNSPVLRRYLYPSFNRYEELDGNPYFQMDGGWNSNVVADKNGNVYNMQFDVDDNIVYTDFLSSGWSDDSGVVFDNERLYKETIRNIRTFDNVAALLAVNGNEVFDGMICHVSKIETESIVLDDMVYPIKHEYFDGEIYNYVSLIKAGNAIKVGRTRIFDTSIVVYGRDGSVSQYELSTKPNGYEVKAYITDDGKFMCKENGDSLYAIDSYQILEGDKDENLTHYFKLTDSMYYDRLAKGELASEEDGIRKYRWTEGWRRLDKSEKEYLKINTIYNYYEGNNPHNGNMRYDSGHEYFTYFNRIFKHAHDYDLFDERCFNDYITTYNDEIDNIGFSGLIENDEAIIQYDDFLVPDKKIHFFGNYLKKTDENTYARYIYGENCERLKNFNIFYSGNTTDDNNGYILSADSGNGWIEDYNPYSSMTSGGVVDEVTNQILNNKRFRITFYLHNEWYTREGQEELKYLDSIVGNYLTQMIPSTVIYEAWYQPREIGMRKMISYSNWTADDRDVSCDENDGSVSVTLHGTKTTVYEEINGD